MENIFSENIFSLMQDKRDNGVDPLCKVVAYLLGTRLNPWFKSSIFWAYDRLLVSSA
jgi:hypothetical protein